LQDGLGDRTTRGKSGGLLLAGATGVIWQISLVRGSIVLTDGGGRGCLPQAATCTTGMGASAWCCRVVSSTDRVVSYGLGVVAQPQLAFPRRNH
jgi:hypothetical protein